MTLVTQRELRQVRSRLGISQAELSRRLGVSASYVSELLAGKKQIVKAPLARAVAQEARAADLESVAARIERRIDRAREGR